MRILITLIFVVVINSLKSQVPDNIKVNLAEEGSSEKVNLDMFYLNHVLYIKAFVLSNIYSTVTAEEMAFIDSTTQKNISLGRRTQFIIQTEQKIPYRLVVSCVKHENKYRLVILTNYNPKKGKFKKKMKDDFYATTADVKDGIVLGNMFEIPLKDKQKYLEKNDYISLINISIFNGEADIKQINKWFELAEKHQKDMKNNYNWLKSYFFLYQGNFVKSKEYLEAMKLSVAGSPEGERNQAKMFIKVLSAEIEIMEAIK